MELSTEIFNKGGKYMNYAYLMKKITESKTITNEEIDNIKKLIEENDLDITDEEYKEQIEKYLNGESKDLYC